MFDFGFYFPQGERQRRKVMRGEERHFNPLSRRGRDSKIPQYYNLHNVKFAHNSQLCINYNHSSTKILRVNFNFGGAKHLMFSWALLHRTSTVITSISPLDHTFLSLHNVQFCSDTDFPNYKIECYPLANQLFPAICLL